MMFSNAKKRQTLIMILTGVFLLGFFALYTVTAFAYTKTGAASDFEIDAISGATITTKAVVNAVNSGIALFNTLGGAQ